MKLYALLMKNSLGTKNTCRNLIRKGNVIVNDLVCRDVDYEVDEEDDIICSNREINTKPYIYYMLNKPAGYVSANRDKHDKCFADLMPQNTYSTSGRLDKDTTGLMILTNDTYLARKLQSPRYHIYKTYYYECLKPLQMDQVKLLEDGITIDSNVVCEKAIVDLITPYKGYIQIFEGKYHQIKKMFLSCGNQITRLKRVAIGNIQLDPNLQLGCYRELTYKELEELKSYINANY